MSALADAQATYHRWCQLYVCLQAWEAWRDTQLDEERARLMMLLAETATLGISALRLPVGGPAPQHQAPRREVVELDGAKLRRRLREIAAEAIRWGRRMAHRLLRCEGWRVNHTLVHRLWREEGLQRPTPKGSGQGTRKGSVRHHHAEHPQQVGAMDFQFHATAEGRQIKSLNVIDDHGRLCLATRVGRWCKVNDVVAVLDRLQSPPCTNLDPQQHRP